MLFAFKLRFIHGVIVSAIAGNKPDAQALFVSLIRPVISLVFILIATALLTPLEVISVRLAIQRNRGSLMHGSPAVAKATDANIDSADIVPDFSAEDVIL